MEWNNKMMLSIVTCKYLRIYVHIGLEQIPLLVGNFWITQEPIINCDNYIYMVHWYNFMNVN